MKFTDLSHRYTQTIEFKTDQGAEDSVVTEFSSGGLAGKHAIVIILTMCK